MREKWKNNKKNTIIQIAELALFLLCLIVMTAIRIAAAGSVEPNPFFDEAAVAAGRKPTLTGLGATDLYLLLLHGVLFVFGNKVGVAAGLQIVLQIAAALLVYLALRQLSGRGTAFIALLLWGFIPYFGRSYTEPTPAALVLAAEALALWTISGIWRRWNRENSKGNPADAVLRYLYVGLLAGLCCCMDFSGIFLLFFLLWVILFCRKRGEGEELIPEGFWNQKGLVCAFCFAAALVSFVGIQVILGVASGNRPPHAMGLWLREVFLGNFRRPVKWSGFLNTWVLLYLLCVAAAGRPVAEWYAGKVAERAASEEREAAEKEKEREQKESDFQYIENPLPLPKKVERKRLDYDYEVSDDDDYDIP